MVRIHMANRTVSIPDDLDKLAREHEKELPAPSHLLAEGYRLALRDIGIEPPPHPARGHTAAATEAARRVWLDRAKDGA